MPGKQKKTAPGKRRTSSAEPPGEGGPDEAASFIAESLDGLSRIARRHRLDHLRYLLAVAKLEAEEHLRLRSRKRLS